MFINPNNITESPGRVVHSLDYRIPQDLLLDIPELVIFEFIPAGLAINTLEEESKET